MSLPRVGLKSEECNNATNTITGVGKALACGVCLNCFSFLSFFKSRGLPLVFIFNKGIFDHRPDHYQDPTCMWA